MCMAIVIWFAPAPVSRITVKQPIDSKWVDLGGIPARKISCFDRNSAGNGVFSAVTGPLFSEFAQFNGFYQI